MVILYNVQWDYLLDLQRSVPPLDPTIDFAFKSAA
ncbi:hypothetical protein BN2475_670023 [Paraburkholderia ribeironis]|uniref:Uncharacterized protein n=1 Tax=Paraburkholderia ribeironis TaxID=1247936 RepID=A0A1N7SGN5_9BURK|nr:hypothetical protein BN2475_670023 [Paraburkholderia ribeironis]